MPLILDGTFNLVTELVGDAELSNNFDGDFNLLSVLDGQLDRFIEVYRGDYEMYNGTYIVIPQTVEQTLDTQDKVLRQDVTVREVPYYEVSNDAGGKTVYIASDIGG